MTRNVVGCIGTGILLIAACDPDGPLTAPPGANAAPELLIVGQRVADEFPGPAGGLSADWYTARPAYAIETGQVSTVTGLGTTLAIWRNGVLPADQFAELVVGDLGGGSFAQFRGLQVSVRTRSLTAGERVSLFYNSAAGRYEIRLDATPGQVLAFTPPQPPPAAGDVMRLEATGETYLARLNGREILRARGPLLAGRLAGFAVILDPSLQSPRRVVDVWTGGPLPTPGSRIPLTEIGPFTYGGFRGGLFPAGRNEMPARHDSVGRARARRVMPRDRSGTPSATGRYVLLSIGMSSTTMEWCAAMPGPCTSWSFTGQARADASVNRSGLVIANGAMGGQTASMWDQPTDLNYNRVRDLVLAPQGLSERQVQVLWLKVANPFPVTPLPTTASDADLLTRQMAGIVRAAKVRYPNLQLVFASSRIYAGYAAIPLNPEPYAYESGLAVKWLVEAQINQMASGAPDARTGDLSYETVAPWVTWGPYLWADGLIARRDGLIWERADFAFDGTHPSPRGQQKVGRLLLNFFKSDPRASCWFLAGGRC